MRFHVVGLPHTNTTSAFASCAYTEKVRKFCRMMTERGHDVFLYAGAANEAPCTEHIPCISSRERIRAVRACTHYTQASFDHTLPYWQSFTKKVILKMKRRIQPRDFICLIAGLANKEIADAFPAHRSVEFGVGYGGYFTPFKVFESYAWMHTCYGARSNNNPHAIDGTWFDAVIPGYLEPEQFHEVSWPKGDYFLYVGRLTARKGVSIAADACKRAGKKLIVAGIGDPPADCEFVGEVNPTQRLALMAGAQALLVPTVYIEPFGNVAVEAMACGTPVITTDWGAFTETNHHRVTGFRCRTMSDFITALDRVAYLDRQTIRDHAMNNYALGPVGNKYEEYFERLTTLWGEGFYA